MNVLVTGGAGYIGSHTVLKLKEKGHRTVIMDNLSRGYRDAIFADAFVESDIAESSRVEKVLRAEKIDAIIHFAAFIEAGESMHKPGNYFENNTMKTFQLIQAMESVGVRRIIFSSTAALYGDPIRTPITEDDALAPTNPYGESKLLVERLLDWYSRIHNWNYVSLRYFNAAGADRLLRSGERHDPETHLIPIALQAAYGIRKKMSIFGDDYPTPDGTCVRDYIHVEDLAQAHVLALDFLMNEKRSEVFNLGNGEGYSVKEVIDLVKEVTGKEFPVSIAPRRPGDPAVLVASSEKIRRILGWTPEIPDLKSIVESADRWVKKTIGL